jgi:DNA modification methylase
VANGNVLFFGDNLEILRKTEYFPSASVDLVYLDPPFSSGRNYNVLFTETNGKASGAQKEAFTDTWHWDMSAATAFADAVQNGGPRVAAAMDAFKKLLDESDTMAYLSMMAPRLVELRRVLKPSGSIYLHCDPTASHPLKILMDSIFGPECFRNEIIWSYRRWPSPAKFYQRMHDVILFYARAPDGPGTFNIEYELNSPSYVKRFKGKTQMLDPDTKTRKIALEAKSKGMPRRDVWDLSIIAGFKKERLGYPTQKPETLLERIIATSSRPNDVVLDPFCGCGTTIAVAQRQGRRWLGIDITYLAIGLVERRLKHAFGPDVAKGWTVIGQPTTVREAEALALRDRYQFQWWVLDRLDAWPRDNIKKKGADQGIDGIINFQESPSSPVRTILIQAKSGGVHRSDVATLSGDMNREGAVIGALVTLEPPTESMRKEAASAGFYSPEDPIGAGRPRYPAIQLLTIAEIVEGARRIEFPERGNVTFRKAPVAQRRDSGRVRPLIEEDEDETMRAGNAPLDNGQD